MAVAIVETVLSSLTVVFKPFTALDRWWEYRDLARNLVAKELKVRYQGAALGFAWSLMNPLMVTVMYLVIFTYIFKSPQTHHALYIVTALVHWTLFSTVILQAPDLLVSNGDLLKKIYFPRLLVPITNVAVNVVLWSMALAVFLALYLPLGGRADWALLAYPLYLLLFIGFSFGLVLVLCVLYVDFRDLKHLVEVLIQLLFWGTPIVYPLTMVPESVRGILLISPLAEFTVIFQDIFWAGQWPSWKIGFAFAAWTVVVLWFGLRLFYRRGAQLIERL